MKKDKTLDFEDYESKNFHVYGVLLTENAVFYNEGNKQKLNSKSNYIHSATFRQWIADLYQFKGLPEPQIMENFGLSTQVYIYIYILIIYFWKENPENKIVWK